MLQPVYPVWRLLVGVRLDEVFRLGEPGFLFLEAAEAESGDGLRVFTFPDGHILAALITLGDQDAGRGHFHSLGNAEGHVIQRILSKTAAWIIRIPIIARHRKIISTALIAHRFFSTIGRRNGEFISGVDSFGEDDGKVAVVVLVLLNEEKRLPVAGHTLHS